MLTCPQPKLHYLHAVHLLNQKRRPLTALYQLRPPSKQPKLFRSDTLQKLVVILLPRRGRDGNTHPALAKPSLSPLHPPSESEATLLYGVIPIASTL